VDSFLRGENPPPDSIVVETGWVDNPWLPVQLRAELDWDRQRDPEKYAHVWGGAYLRRSEARVFRNWRVAEFETPADARFYFGGDWGFSIDPSVMVRAWIDGRTLYIDREVYLIGCEIDFLPFLFGGCRDEELQKLNRSAWEAMPPAYRGWQGIEGSRKWPSIADSARPETIDYLKRHGFPKMEAATKGAGSVEEGVEFLRSYDIVVHPRCQHTIDELTCYSYKTDRMTDEVLPVLEDKDNHVIDALRYAVEKARRSRPDYMAWLSAGGKKK
jgi:phage terminase large subunit